MAEKPILFNGEMVRAILADRKTQTRRPVKWPVMSRSDGSKQRIFTADDAAEMNQLMRERQRYPLMQIKSPFGKPGDLLYVRETWTQPENVIYYRADEAALLPPGAKWRPSIHMPKWAARIWLRVTGVRVERVRDITRDDVRAEGLLCEGHFGAYHFADAWEAAYPGSWERNDWVWVYEFERVERAEGGAS